MDDELEHVQKLPCLPERERDSHKGDFGRVLSVAGSPGMTGAGCMVTRAAQRAGAGLATLALPQSLNAAAEIKLTSSMSLPLPDTPSGTLGREAGERLLAVCGNYDLAALGPGLGRSDRTFEMVRRVLPGMDLPLVLDADGLNAVAGHLDAVEARQHTTVLTPHPGEMKRLSGASSVKEVQSRARSTAAELAEQCGAIVALKGHGTIVTDGESYYVNTTGNPGMASGGSGDVLTGLIAGLMCQDLTAFGATCLAVFLHGLAGDLAAAERTELCLIPEDIMTFIPAAAARIPTSAAKAGEEYFAPAEVTGDID